MLPPGPAQSQAGLSGGALHLGIGLLGQWRPAGGLGGVRMAVADAAIRRIPVVTSRSPNGAANRRMARTLLIHAEQGFGDTLQFCRFATLAAAKGLRVILEVPRPLPRLLSNRRRRCVITPGEPLPHSICTARCSARRWRWEPHRDHPHRRCPFCTPMRRRSRPGKRASRCWPERAADWHRVGGQSADASRRLRRSIAALDTTRIALPPCFACRDCNF